MSANVWRFRLPHPAGGPPALMDMSLMDSNPPTNAADLLRRSSNLSDATETPSDDKSFCCIVGVIRFVNQIPEQFAASNQWRERLRNCARFACHMTIQDSSIIGHPQTSPQVSLPCVFSHSARTDGLQTQ